MTQNFLLWITEILTPTKHLFSYIIGVFFYFFIIGDITQKQIWCEIFYAMKSPS